MEPWSSTVVRSQKARLPSVAALHRNNLLGARGKAVGSVRGMESNRSPHLAHAGASCSLSHRRWLGASCVKECTLRTHRLWWKVSARSCSRRPESCKRKSLGGGGWPGSEPILETFQPLSLGLRPPSSHLTAPSLQAAATRGPRPGLSNSHIARDIYLQRQHTGVSQGKPGSSCKGLALHDTTLCSHLAVHITWSLDPL